MQARVFVAMPDGGRRQESGASPIEGHPMLTDATGSESDAPPPEATESPPVQEKTSPGIGMPASIYLQDFGQVVLDAFGEIPYHVGSSLVSNGRPSWRDVDVRLILSDERYAADGYGDPEYPHRSTKWVALVKAFSTARAPDDGAADRLPDPAADAR